MLKKIERPIKVSRQDRMQPKNAEEMIKKYALESEKLYDYLDEIAVYINTQNEKNSKDKKLSEILWENPNVGTAIAENTVINLKNSDYDYLEFFFIFSISEANLKNQQSTSCIKGNSITLCSIGYSTGSMVRRIIDYIDDTTYKTRGGKRDSSNNNECCIPVKVVGHKMVIKNE